ncbi:tetratricopeptide repeat protein [Streptacidiphilus sp. PB12-B1b]|uniref:tetratricopeptide repeat protein n=1 Tax=Streptacidiphilus sp. PB12-B1b TaxID=2705012 RepID=UPI0015FD3FF9|nr:tetratricopeptide repeat protein [Streptacidiphilus sp. PB12-B1b]QMU77851.1 tetratricopeptide repeat protein [Streptacidiphilus sp. PB12-B1b]
MAPVRAHQLFVTPDGRRPDAAVAEDGAPLLLPPVNAHRRLRGPYTAAGTILRAVVPGALERHPELVAAHVIEILSTSPELHRVVPATTETLTSLAIPKERTRFYSRMRTLRIAHGLTGFLHDLLLLDGGEPRTLVVDHLDAADPTDQEFFGVLLRRIPAGLLAVSAVVGPDAAPEPLLAAALERHTVRRPAPDAAPAEAAPAPAALTGEALTAAARAYVAGECLDADPALRAAYQAVGPEQRARLHDERAAELEAAAEGSLRLGAVPFHREHGSDPLGAGVPALLAASDWCIENGFYDATVDLAKRGLELVGELDDDADADPLTTWWPLTTKVTMSLAALDRAAEAMAMYDAVRARTTLPRVHMHAAYATAMLYTRHLPEGQRDHRLALGWTNIAIAIASQLQGGEDQAFSTVFQQNGRALVEGHLGNAEEALALVTGGLERLDRELGEGEHGLHRSVLRHNRAQVLKGLGRLDEARQDYEKVIALDPNYAEYHFEYAGLLRRLGRHEQALREYTRAMELTPPFVELYYNRGDLRAVTGDVDGALADFGFALELDPEYVDAYVNRAALLLNLGELEAAAQDVAAGLALAPDHAHLRCQQARVDWEGGDLKAALAGLDRAVLSAPEMAEAWALRAAVRFDSADLEGALADLGRSLEIEDSAVVRYNRGSVYEALGQWAQAADDYTRAIEGDPADPDGWLRRAVCRTRLGDTGAARADLEHFTGIAPERSQEAEAVQAGEPVG